tara:strand:+ start:23419 stop:25398 length:1980 start_codon:yes stop_codon:yes gene_type:complete
MKYPRFRLLERFNYLLERQFVKGTHIQLLFVIALIGVISVVGGMLALPSGEPGSNIGESIWWAFLRLSDPGYLGDDEGTWRRVISTLLTVAGYVVFMGSMVAIITSWLNRKIRSLEQGLTRVTARNHIIILGWTNRTVHIAAELFQSSKRVKRFLKRHGARALKLIILSDDVNPHRLQELKDHPLIGKRANEIVLRSGNAIDREHLNRVDCMHAAAIIIPSQSNANKELITPDVGTIKTLLSLNSEMQSHHGIGKMPYVVAEIQDENKVKSAQRSYKGPLEVIPSDAILSRLIAQNLHHPGLSVVFNELLSHSLNNNLYVFELPEAEGTPFSSLKPCFPRAILLGVVRENEGHFTPYLNPEPGLVIEEKDRLIFIAKKMEDVEILPETVKEKANNIIPKTFKQRPITGNYSGVSKLLVLGWNNHVPALIKELGTYSNQEFQITLASIRPLDVRKSAINHILDSVNNITCTHAIIDYIRESELRSLNPSTFDHILLLSSDKLAVEEEADARTIVGYTLLEEILESEETHPQIVMELNDPGNELLIRNFKSESIIGPLILSNLLATIAMRRELYSVYNELFTVNGAEIIFRNLEEYDLNTGKMNFIDLEEHISVYQDTLLGVYYDEPDGEVDLQLNIPRHRAVILKPECRLVVLSTINATG